MDKKTPTEKQYEDVVLATEIKTVFAALCTKNRKSESKGMDINIELGLPLAHILGHLIAQYNFTNNGTT
jgi:hypothetical protein